jgi:threonine synthase
MRASLERQPLKTRHERDIFRYADMLPLEQSPPEMLTVGWTPLYRFPLLNRAVGLENLFIKDDTVNPSGSLKDRASAVAIAMAIESGSGAIACASTGNAASSLAVLSASAGLASYIFVPETIPPAKLYQIGACAAGVFRVKGTYENAFDVATDAIERWGWYNRNCAINPYLVEGKKTCSLEIFEQLGYKVPDWVVVSVGDGCIISGQWKAFKELKMLGQTTAMPRMLAVQASGCRPIVDAFCCGEDVSPVDARTVADSIRVGQPRNWRKALRAVRESGGNAISVSDSEIISAMLLLGRKAGIFAEPAGAAGFAGLRKAVEEGIVARDETVAVLVTGSGLKDPGSLEGHVEVADIGADADQVGPYLEGGDNE